ncbi:hypothetical protein NQZ79_g200 [Umbelopsis isabellina]|nr:hypothetical protein NQZ79_g200 [Umbelopsis isabellina]
MASVAVLGGGISGLTTAYYLSKLLPQGAKVVLLEGSHRLGGWLESNRVKPGHHVLDQQFASSSDDEMIDNSKLLFESGPRTLRPVGPGGVMTLELIRELNLAESIIAVPKTHPSARNRYILYEDKINTLPSSLGGMLRNPPPIMRSVLMSGFKELFVKPSTSEDESIYDFTERRFGTHVAQNLVGAMVHGIYAGDAKELSVRSTLKVLWENERAFGSVVKGMLRGGTKMDRFRERGMMTRAREGAPDWFADMEKMSVIGFKNGVDTLTRALQSWLVQRENVEIKFNQHVQSIDIIAEDDCKITTNQGTVNAAHIISALPATQLDKILHNKIPHLSHNPYVDVGVVNLAYDPDAAKLEYDGFGFLTPHPSSKRTHAVPGTLGVVFDSNAIGGQEQSSPIKVTAMLGGHLWNSTFDAPASEIDPTTVRDRAVKAIQTHLGIDAPPTHTMTKLQLQCIPQYRVGHYQRLCEMHQSLTSQLGQSLSVTGSSYWGVSVPDCIKNSRELVEELCVSGALGSRAKVVSGLGRVTEGNAKERLRDSANISKGHINVLMKS